MCALPTRKLSFRAYAFVQRTKRESNFQDFPKILEGQIPWWGGCQHVLWRCWSLKPPNTWFRGTPGSANFSPQPWSNVIGTHCRAQKTSTTKFDEFFYKCTWLRCMWEPTCHLTNRYTSLTHALPGQTATGIPSSVSERPPYCSRYI